MTNNFIGIATIVVYINGNMSDSVLLYYKVEALMFKT